MIVYIVTSGSYSDYKIEAVFDNKEMAKVCASNNDEANDVEEYVINELADKIKQGISLHHITMCKDGRVTQIYKMGYGDESANLYDWGPPGLQLYINTYAKDENHAIKIANEKRAQLIAENKWVK